MGGGRSASLTMAIPARGGFPYCERTVAEIDAQMGDHDAFAAQLARVATGAGIVERIPMHDRRYDNRTLGGVGGEIL